MKRVYGTDAMMSDEELEAAEEKRIAVENAQEFLGCLAFAALVVAFVWLYLKATPSQGSGECDRAAEALRAVDAAEVGAR